MPTAETLRALLALVGEAKAGSRELDAAFWYAIVEKPRPGDKLDRDIIGKWPAYSSDTDILLDIVESRLPTIKAFAAGSPPSSGWKLNFYRGMTPTGAPYALWQANIRQHASDGFDGDGSTLPLAIMAAFLKAKVALLQQSDAAHVER